MSKTLYQKVLKIHKNLTFRLNNSTLRVFQELAWHLNQNNRQCFPHQKTLAKETGRNIRTVKSSIKILKELKLVFVERSNRHKGNYYFINERKIDHILNLQGNNICSDNIDFEEEDGTKIDNNLNGHVDNFTEVLKNDPLKNTEMIPSQSKTEALQSIVTQRVDKMKKIPKYQSLNIIKKSIYIKETVKNFTNQVFSSPEKLVNKITNSSKEKSMWKYTIQEPEDISNKKWQTDMLPHYTRIFNGNEELAKEYLKEIFHFKASDFKTIKEFQIKIDSLRNKYEYLAFKGDEQ